MESKLEIFATHQFKCRGNGKKNTNLLDESEAVAVILKVRKDGSTIPLCPYYKDPASGMCDISTRKWDKGVCPYVS